MKRTLRRRSPRSFEVNLNLPRSAVSNSVKTILDTREARNRPLRPRSVKVIQGQMSQVMYFEVVESGRKLNILHLLEYETDVKKSRLVKVIWGQSSDHVWKLFYGPKNVALLLYSFPYRSNRKPRGTGERLVIDRIHFETSRCRLWWHLASSVPIWIYVCLRAIVMLFWFIKCCSKRSRISSRSGDVVPVAMFKLVVYYDCNYNTVFFLDAISYGSVYT